MKRLFCMFLTLTLFLGLFSGCSPPPSPESTPTTAPCVPETTVPPETENPALEKLRNNLPRMDGSTSLIPLEAGIRAALFGISIEEATKDVRHTSSWSSFYNLLDGTVDLIFSVPLSAEQQALADEQGVGISAIPIARECFVFVVNAENPVDSLTQQQIRDIYSGKITNWSEVGGLDEEIIPYQRNRDSGSQNYMLAFMGDTPLMDAPSELRPASMVGLMDVIAVNDNSRAAIGYSVYAYAANMYGNGNEIKFIKVDGVAPSKQSCADWTYPLTGMNFAVIRADEPDGSPARQLVDWLLSKEGQWAVAEAGYVTIADTGYNYAEETIDKYEGVGLGASAMAEAPAREYVVYAEVPRFGGLPVDEHNHLTHLADAALQQEVNDWIDAQIPVVSAEYDHMIQVVNGLNGGEESGLYSLGFGGDDPVRCSAYVKNGYLSVAVSLCYWKNGNNEHYKYYRTETAVWDLLTGKKLTNEELFCQGVDIDQVLNAYLRNYTQYDRSEFWHDPEMKRDFVVLGKTGWHMTAEGIYIDYGSDAFVNGEFIPFDWFPDGVLAPEIPRDCTDAILADDTVRVIHRIRTSDRDLAYAYYADSETSDWCDVELLKEDFHPNAARINEDILNHLSTYFREETIRAYFEKLGYPELNNLWLRWYSDLLGGRYLLVQGSKPDVYLPETETFLYYPYDADLLYDLETGQRIHWTELLEVDWLANSTMRQSYPDIPIEVPYYEGLTTDWVRYYNDTEVLTVCLSDGEAHYYLYIPIDYMIF